MLLIERNEVRLQGRLTYTIRGAPIASLEVAIPGWELDEVGPDNLVALDGVTQSAGNLVIPLIQPSSGTLESAIAGPPRHRRRSYFVDGRLAATASQFQRAVLLDGGAG